MGKNGNQMESSGRIPRPQDCEIECKFELKDGRVVVLETPDTLKQIEADRPAVFLFDDLKFCVGYTDGCVDAEGLFRIYKSRGLAVATGYNIDTLFGWTYLENFKSLKEAETT